MLIIPSVILAIEDESDRDLMEQVYRQYCNTPNLPAPESVPGYPSGAFSMYP